MDGIQPTNQHLLILNGHGSHVTIDVGQHQKMWGWIYLPY
jgi:hypothetical protein